MSKSVFYHAGCPVCSSTEHEFINLLGADNVEVIHFGNYKSRIVEAEKGVANRLCRSLFKTKGVTKGPAALSPRISLGCVTPTMKSMLPEPPC